MGISIRKPNIASLREKVPQWLVKGHWKTLPEKNDQVELKGLTDPKTINWDFFWDYDLFPHQILTGFGAWQPEKRKMQLGDDILQIAFLPPNPQFSLKIVMGVRITEIYQDSERFGFAYETLQGHLEIGLSRFLIEKQGNHWYFRVQTFSSPGTVFFKWIGPLGPLPYQRYCTRKALEKVAREVKKQVDAKN